MSKAREKRWLKQCSLAIEESRKNGWDYVRIPVTKGRVTLVDGADYERVRDKGPWCSSWNTGTKSYRVVSSRSHSPSFVDDRAKGKRVRWLLHRFLVNAPGDMDVDHISHDTLDNRRANLRIATRSENLMNRQKRGGSSRYKGVTWDKFSGRWKAQIGVKGKRISLGRFAAEEAAARAYDEAAKKHFGEYALTNEDLGLYEGD